MSDTKPSSDPAAEAASALQEALEKFYASRHGAPGWQRQEVAYLMAANGPLASFLADIAALRTRAEEAEAQATRINEKLGELNSAVKECLPPAETLIAEREAAEARAEAATADRDRLAEENARMRSAVEATLTEACQMPAILLMAGEMTAQERRTARAVAEGLAAKVRRALDTATGGNDA